MGVGRDSHLIVLRTGEGPVRKRVPRVWEPFYGYIRVGTDDPLRGERRAAVAHAQKEYVYSRRERQKILDASAPYRVTKDSGSYTHPESLRRMHRVQLWLMKTMSWSALRECRFTVQDSLASG